MRAPDSVKAASRPVALGRNQVPAISLVAFFVPQL